MNKIEMTEAIILAKKEKGLSWQSIADELGMGVVWVTSACFGMNRMDEAQAGKLCSALSLGDDVKDALQEFCHKDFSKKVPTDPVIYRFYEIVGVYGDTIKAVIHEKFGDGIMSAIDFNMTIDKEKNPAGDRVVITMNGKFLPYRSLVTGVNYMADGRVPVTVLTGFLGSGKTTLLNRILTEQHGKRIAVIENEFGEIGIDNELVIRSDEEIFEMNNGCICCTVRGDLIRILGRLMARKDSFDSIMIETTGLADPGPVAQTFFMDDEIKDKLRLDAIVTLVDSAHVAQHIDSSDECQEQIAFADVILLNKTDLVKSKQGLQSLEEKSAGMNSVAKIHKTEKAQIDLQEILDVHAFDLDSKLEIDPDFMKEEFPFEWSGVYQLSAGLFNVHCQDGPDPEMNVVLLPLCCDADADLLKAKKQAMLLFSSNPINKEPGQSLKPGESLYALQLNQSHNKFSFEIKQAGFYMLFTQHLPEEFAMQAVQNGNERQPVKSEAYASPHEHDESVSSVGLSDGRSVDPGRFESWITGLLRTKGVDIFRMKGIINLAGEDNRFVFQGVHMLFDGEPDRPWGDDVRHSQLVFIGRNLDRASLEQGFQACLV